MQPRRAAAAGEGAAPATGVGARVEVPCGAPLPFGSDAVALAPSASALGAPSARHAAPCCAPPLLTAPVNASTLAPHTLSFRPRCRPARRGSPTGPGWAEGAGATLPLRGRPGSCAGASCNCSKHPCSPADMWTRPSLIRRRRRRCRQLPPPFDQSVHGAPGPAAAAATQPLECGCIANLTVCMAADPTHTAASRQSEVGPPPAPTVPATQPFSLATSALQTHRKQVTTLPSTHSSSSSRRRHRCAASSLLRLAAVPLPRQGSAQSQPPAG